MFWNTIPVSQGRIVQTKLPQAEGAGEAHITGATMCLVTDASSQDWQLLARRRRRNKTWATVARGAWPVPSVEEAQDMVRAHWEAK